MAIYSWFIHEKWGLSIAMLVYQRVYGKEEWPTLPKCMSYSCVVCWYPSVLLYYHMIYSSGHDQVYSGRGIFENRGTWSEQLPWKIILCLRFVGLSHIIYIWGRLKIPCPTREVWLGGMIRGYDSGYDSWVWFVGMIRGLLCTYTYSQNRPDVAK